VKCGMRYECMVAIPKDRYEQLIGDMSKGGAVEDVGGAAEQKSETN